jgi:hypothetical protein
MTQKNSISVPGYELGGVDYHNPLPVRLIFTCTAKDTETALGTPKEHFAV